MVVKDVVLHLVVIAEDELAVRARMRRRSTHTAIMVRARRPDLYAKLVEPLPNGEEPVINPGWRLTAADDDA